MGKFEFYASIPGDSTCANSENFNLGLKIWEEREYLNSSCNSCKVISVSISYRDLIKDQMFTHIEFNWVWEEVKLYSMINQIQARIMQFGTSLLHWRAEVGKIPCSSWGVTELTELTDQNDAGELTKNWQQQNPPHSTILLVFVGSDFSALDSHKTW